MAVVREEGGVRRQPAGDFGDHARRAAARELLQQRAAGLVRGHGRGLVADFARDGVRGGAPCL